MTSPIKRLSWAVSALAGVAMIWISVGNEQGTAGVIAFGASFFLAAFALVQAAKAQQPEDE